MSIPIIPAVTCMTLGSGGRSSCTTRGRGRQGAELVRLVQGESLATLRRLEARAITTVNIAVDMYTRYCRYTRHCCCSDTDCCSSHVLMFSHVSFPPSTSHYSLLIKSGRQPRRPPVVLCHNCNLHVQTFVLCLCIY